MLVSTSYFLNAILVPLNSYLPSELSVIVGQYSLIQPDLDEKVINVFKINIYSGYNDTTMLHDIAMLQVNAYTPMKTSMM